MKLYMNEFWKDQQGQDTVEFALAVGMVAVAGVDGLPQLSGTVDNVFSKVASIYSPPSDVALTFPGTDEPTILFSSRSEGGEPSEHPIIFTSKVKKAYEHLRTRGVVAAGLVHDEWGTQLFQITDSEGNSIEVCKEP